MHEVRAQPTTSGTAPAYNGVDDVLHCTIRILEALLRRLRPVPPFPELRLSAPEHESLPERPLWLAMYGIDIRPCPGCGMGRIV